MKIRKMRKFDVKDAVYLLAVDKVVMNIVVVVDVVEEVSENVEDDVCVDQNVKDDVYVNQNATSTSRCEMPMSMLMSDLASATSMKVNWSL